MMRNRVILFLSSPLAVLLVLVSCTGLFTPGFYSAETMNWQVQSAGQDLINLIFITPVLLVTTIFAYKNSRSAMMMWGGVVLYLTYTFTLYCFDVHFNRLFVVYCLCLGLSFYSMIYFLHTHFIHMSWVKVENVKLIRVVGIYFIILSVSFYLLWLAEIIPSIIQNATPQSIAETGLFTNGVHVLDLAIVLPGIFITGLFLLKRNPIGLILTPVFLTFFILMDITIGVLVLLMHLKGLATNLSIAIIIGVLTLISMILLKVYLSSLKYEES